MTDDLAGEAAKLFTFTSGSPVRALHRLTDLVAALTARVRIARGRWRT